MGRPRAEVLHELGARTGVEDLKSLAAILILVGYKLASFDVFKGVYAQGKRQFIPFMTTVVAIIFTDLLTGIFIGLAVAMFHILYVNYLNGFYFKPEQYQPGKTIVLNLIEHVTFINKASIIQTLNDIPDNAKVVIDGSLANDIDHDVWEVIQEFKVSAVERNIDLEMIGASLQDKVGKRYNRVEIV